MPSLDSTKSPRIRLHLSISTLFFFSLFLSPIALAEPGDSKFLNWLLGPEAQAASLSISEAGLDGLDGDCISCHNGSRASNIPIKDAAAPMQFSSHGKQENHPVFMSYNEYASRKPREFTGHASLDPNILLPDGYVTCVSCHRLKQAQTVQYSVDMQGVAQLASLSTETCTASRELTVGPRQTDLCLACHKM